MALSKTQIYNLRFEIITNTENQQNIKILFLINTKLFTGVPQLLSILLDVWKQFLVHAYKGALQCKLSGAPLKVF